MQSRFSDNLRSMTKVSLNQEYIAYILKQSWLYIVCMYLHRTYFTKQTSYFQVKMKTTRFLTRDPSDNSTLDSEGNCTMNWKFFLKELLLFTFVFEKPLWNKICSILVVMNHEKGRHFQKKCVWKYISSEIFWTHRELAYSTKLLLHNNDGRGESEWMLNNSDAWHLK